jgi:hypothetical protein
VPPGHNDAGGGRHKDDEKDGRDMHQLCESGSQSNRHMRIAETTQVDEINGAMLQPGQYRMVAQESAAFDQQKKGPEFIVVRLPFSVVTLSLSCFLPNISAGEID